jgi:hypothetical protein
MGKINAADFQDLLVNILENPDFLKVLRTKLNQSTRKLVKIFDASRIKIQVQGPPPGDKWAVTVKAVVSPVAGQSLMGDPTFTIYDHADANGNVLAGPSSMSSVGSDVWEAHWEVYSVEPKSAKVRASCFDAQGMPITNEDIANIS